MGHLHIGVLQAFVIYLWIVLFRTLFQFLAIWLHGTRIGQAIAFMA